MVLNEEDRRPIPIKNLYYQKSYGTKMMKGYPAKSWKKIALNLSNQLKENRNCAQELTRRSSHPIEQAKQTAAE